MKDLMNFKEDYPYLNIIITGVANEAGFTLKPSSEFPWWFDYEGLEPQAKTILTLGEDILRGPKVDEQGVRLDITLGVTDILSIIKDLNFGNIGKYFWYE